MITLPRLTPLIQLVDPKTGISTVRGIDFWGQFARQIETNINALDEQEASLAAAQAQIVAALAQIATAQAAASAAQTSVAAILAGTTAVALDTAANTWAAVQTYSVAPTAPGYDVGGVQVLGAQQPAIASLAGTATLAQVITAFNTLLAELRTHGIIAT